MVDPLLALSYLVHVVSAGLWTGSVLYVVYAVLPPARAGEFGREAFGVTVDRLLRVTRWTGISLPLTGVYQIWVLYPTDALLGTTRGHLVLGMALLWTVMNGVVETGVYRMRTLEGELSLGRYLSGGYLADGGSTASVERLAATGRPYLLAAAAMAVLLLADAALLNVVA